jgi:ubiquinone/menaquinone biosynthesis C-methylase UbiE
MSNPPLDTILRNARRLCEPGGKLIVLNLNRFTPTYVIRAYDPRYIHDEQYIATVEK